MPDKQLELVSSLIERDCEHHHYLHLRRSFDIARWQGCRVAETQLNPQTGVALSRDPNGVIVSGTIRFRIRGNRHHTTTLHPRPFALFDQLQREGATSTYPPYFDKRGHPRISFLWNIFQRRHRLKRLIPGWTFHCLRVTVVTGMARSNVPEPRAMRFTAVTMPSPPQYLGDLLVGVEPVIGDLQRGPRGGRPTEERSPSRMILSRTPSSTLARAAKAVFTTRFLITSMDYSKQLLNLTHDNAEALKRAANISGLTKSQMVNDALKVLFGIQDPMLASRLDVVRAALKDTGQPKCIRYSDLPPSGASANEPTPPARKTTPRRSK